MTVKKAIFRLGRWALTALGMITTALPAQAQMNPPMETVRAIERSIAAFVTLGVDPQSAKLVQIRETSDFLKDLAAQIMAKQESNNTLKARLKILKAEAQSGRSEIERLTKLMAQKSGVLEEEMMRCFEAGSRHDKKPHIFKSPEEDLERAAYDAEAKKLKDWHNDILVRHQALTESAEAQSLKALTARADEINGEAAGLEGRMDASIQADFIRFSLGVEDIKGLIAEIAKPLRESRVRWSKPQGKAWVQLGEVAESGGIRFDTPLTGRAGEPSPNRRLPSEVLGNDHFKRMSEEQQALDLQIKELRAKVFDPRASANEIEATVKKMQELESQNVSLRYQIGLMAAPDSLPASAGSRLRSVPLHIPDRKQQR